jgi:hypothetical protein
LAKKSADPILAPKNQLIKFFPQTVESPDHTVALPKCAKALSPFSNFLGKKKAFLEEKTKPKNHSIEKKFRGLTIRYCRLSRFLLD